LWIRTQQGKRLSVTEVVPQVLEPNRRTVVALRPQDCDHLTERSNRPSVRPGASEDSTHAFTEQLLIWPAVSHELGERVFSIERNIPVVERCGIHIQS